MPGRKNSGCETFVTDGFHCRPQWKKEDFLAAFQSRLLLEFNRCLSDAQGLKNSAALFEADKSLYLLERPYTSNLHFKTHRFANILRGQARLLQAKDTPIPDALSPEILSKVTYGLNEFIRILNSINDTENVQNKLQMCSNPADKLHTFFGLFEKSPPTTSTD
ncbi:hypothetical protein CEXT_156251 [Caerostris extrusa]|uniref:Uncharacterized protein n=1 Tax=Caerostris extrusa TaxID=172846 RepID=A0AAV4Y2X8_CAEEX|nr:hypothetical protein CEXT_156251 [Caerostris extrusa]